MIKRHSKILAITLALTLLLGIGLASGLDLFKAKKTDVHQQAKEELLNQGIINILLLGIDARPGETKARSDSMILASIDTTNKKVGLISIPRDTRIKDGDHYQKINAYNFIGGPELAKTKVEELLGVPVHYYALTNFSGFKGIIDILGGVSIDVDKRMYKPSEDIDLKPGMQRLDGAQALAFCRFRTDALGDIMRIQRQQTFIKAVAAEMMQPSTLTKLPKLMPQIKQCVTTDIPMSKMLKIARAAEQFQQGQSQMVAQSLPGWFFNDPDTGASYWLVDEQKLPGMVDKVLNGETVDFIEGTIAAQPKKVKPQPPEIPVVEPDPTDTSDNTDVSLPPDGDNPGNPDEPDPGDTSTDSNSTPAPGDSEPVDQTQS
ncbi:MAG: LCP family protein [Methylocystaceae bacterium]